VALLKGREKILETLSQKGKWKEEKGPLIHKDAEGRKSFSEVLLNDVLWST
jgi:hypothetical protein